MNFKKGFTLLELMIVVAIMGILSVFGLNSLVSSQVKQKYDTASYKIIQFIKKARIASMSNFTEYNKNGSSLGKFLIPSGGYGVQIEKKDKGIVALKYFYNKNDNSKLDNDDVIIEEWESVQGSAYLYDIGGSGSHIKYPSSNSNEDSHNQSKIVIIFRNFTGKYPDDGSVFITSGDLSNNNIKELKISLYMFFNSKKVFKRRIVFDRISKIITLQSCKRSNNNNLETCNDSGEKKWVLNF